MVIEAAAILLTTWSPIQGKQCEVPSRPPSGSTLRMVLKLDLTLLDSEAVPVPHATVRFVDAAPPPSQRDAGRIVGSTGADGRMSAQVAHEWDDYFSETRRPDSGAFDIVVHAPNGEDAVRHLVVECLPRVGDRYSAQVRILLTRTRDSIIIY
jgi:hypothetical protein